MKSRLSVGIAVALAGVLLLAACGSGGSPSGGSTKPAEPSGDPVAGKTAFEGTCVSCHGLDAKGVPGLGKDLTANDFIKGKTDAELIAFIKQGRSTSDPLNTTGVDMPAKGGNPALSDTDIANIVAYMRQLNK